MVNVFNLHTMFVSSGLVVASFLLSHVLASELAAEARTHGTACELSLNVSKKVFEEGDSVIIYGDSPYNAQLSAAMLPVSDGHLYTKADVFDSQGCHYTHVLGTFSNNKTGYYWVAISEADVTGVEQGDPKD